MILPALVTLFLISAYPIFYSLWLSFNNIDLATETWKFVGLAKYSQAFNDWFVVKSMGTTIRYMLFVGTISVSTGVGIALLLNENFHGKRLLLTLAILPWAVSSYGTAIVWRYIYSSQIGLINSVLYQLGLVSDYVPLLTPKSALILVAVSHSWQLIPIGAFFVLASLQVIPEDLYRSAKVDGLGVIQRFRYVTWSYIRGTVAIFTVLVLSWASKVFDTLWFMAAGGPGTATTTLSFKIYDATFLKLDLGYGAALSIILYFLVAAIAIVYFQLVTRGGKSRL